MAYTPATSLPPSLVCFQWATIADPNPTLTAPLSPDDTTAYFSSAPKDHTGAVVTPPFLMGIKSSDSYVMTALCTAIAVDGLSGTIVQGIRLEGLDYTTSDTDLIPEEGFNAGDAIFCNISAVIQALTIGAIKGQIATSGLGLILGDSTDTNVTISQKDASSTKGFLRKNPTSAKVQYSNDGSVWVNIDSVSASNLVAVSAADTTPSYLDAKITVDADTMAKAITSPGGDEKLELSARGGLADMIDDVTATATEINTALDGITAGVTAANLNTLTDTSNADALHSHLSPTKTLTAYEAISALDSVALLPIEVEWFGQLTEATSALGDSNVRRKYAMKIIPSVTTSSLTTMQFRAAEQVNGATTVGSLLISIQSDSAGSPSGTPIANGSANAITQATQRTWNTTFASRTATWASPPTLTAGTTYWLVFECQSTDVTNYLKIGDASTYDESYLTFTRLTYNADAATWGNSTTTTPLFFWFNTQVHLLGCALCQTDANWGGRTWSFVGFAKNAISANASGLVYYQTAPLTGLTPNSTYYLSETPGQLTTTPPASFQNGATVPTKFTYRVGYADEVVFNIDKGAKVVNIVTGTLTSTTTQNYITWFKPIDMQIKGVGGVAVASEASESFGFASDASAVYSVTHGNSGGTASANSVFMSVDSGTSDSFSAAISLISNAGFTVTYTESGTYGMAAIIRAQG